jgi:uncharacterized RDD family membrane protein YckC
MSTTPPPPSAWRQQQSDWQAAQAAQDAQAAQAGEQAQAAQAAYPPPPPGQYGYGYGYPQPHVAYPAAEYAGWWQRFGAIVLDWLLVGLPLFILGLVTGLIETRSSDLDGTFIGFQAGPVWLGLSTIVTLLYYGLLEGGAGGASVGKIALGIQVRDANSGGPIGFGKAVLRRFIYQVLWAALFIPGLINGLSPLWDARKQAWHDKAVNSVVVRRS